MPQIVTSILFVSKNKFTIIKIRSCGSEVVRGLVRSG